jgi:hypothetical protein
MKGSASPKRLGKDKRKRPLQRGERKVVAYFGDTPIYNTDKIAFTNIHFRRCTQSDTIPYGKSIESRLRK